MFVFSGTNFPVCGHTRPHPSEQSSHSSNSDEVGFEGKGTNLDVGCWPPQSPGPTWVNPYTLLDMYSLPSRPPCGDTGLPPLPNVGGKMKHPLGVVQRKQARHAAASIPRASVSAGSCYARPTNPRTLLGCLIWFGQGFTRMPRVQAVDGSMGGVERPSITVKW